MSGVQRREQCPQCASEGRDSSGDNLARYSDGHGYCHVCRYYEPAGGKVKVNRGYPMAEKSSTTVEQVVTASAVRALPERGISKAIAERYGVRVAVDEVTGENSVHYYPYHKKGKLVGFKQRRLPKQFSSVGSMNDVGLFGQNLYEGERRKLLLVCEGEIDCLSVAELLSQKGKDYAVVSIQSGADADGTVKANLKSQAEFFGSFEKVILCFDNDAPGLTYAQAVADWLCTIVKVGIMPVDMFGEYKDVNDLLLHEKGSLFWTVFAKTKAYEPDSIIRGDSISVEQLQQVPHKGYELPFEGLQNMLKGLRKGELTLATGGSGLGKTSVVKEICLDVALRNKATFGYMSLEESVEMAARSFVAMYHNVPVGRLTFNPNLLTNDQWEEARAALFTSGLFTFFDSSKFLDFDQLMNKVEFFAKGINCDFLVIDNLTLVSARSEDGDERKAIDKTMAALAGIAASTGIGIILVNHLKRQNNKSPNNGDMVEIQDLRGSGSLEAFSNNIIAVERNQQAEDEVQRNMTRIRVLKNRMFGKTGVACSVLYNPDTGRMAEPINDF